MTGLDDKPTREGNPRPPLFRGHCSCAKCQLERYVARELAKDQPGYEHFFEGGSEIDDCLVKTKQTAKSKLFADLVDALRSFAEVMPPADARCHFGICSQQDCGNCSRIAKAREVIFRADQLDV